MVQEQWLQLKKVFIGVLLENCYLVGGLTFGGGWGNKNLVGGSILWVEFFQVGGMSKFSTVRGDYLHPSSMENPEVCLEDRDFLDLPLYYFF